MDLTIFCTVESIGKVSMLKYVFTYLLRFWSQGSLSPKNLNFTKAYF
uniref:Uncharacterized protein n=1 Tax=Arundo donax TaxID=35708 RepID=A0A0A9FVI3_ARUDO